MKAAFAIIALLVLALSWTGSGAVDVEVSEELDGLNGANQHVAQQQSKCLLLGTVKCCQSLPSTFMISASFDLVPFSRKMD